MMRQYKWWSPMHDEAEVVEPHECMKRQKWWSPMHDEAAGPRRK